MSNTKVLVLISKLINIPSQKENVLKFIEGPKERIVENHKETSEDVPVILPDQSYTSDGRNAKHTNSNENISA